MAARAPDTTSVVLERIARDLHDLSFDFIEPATSVVEFEARVARAEDLAEDLRSAVRRR